MSGTTKQCQAIRGIQSGVQAWHEPVTIPTYLPEEADPNPMFLEKRVYQGSSGKVYLLPFIDRVSSTKSDHEYQALHIENEFLYLMVLPEIGGRIQIGFDKKTNYDFFYRQDVIKPALVGLAGPWISGGVEFNWPQHHRPSTYMPCSWSIEESADGSKTIWLSEHDAMNRMKGMHGICLRPDSSLIELKARLYNRTPLTQTFLWWANVAARVHERYQSFFPPDVRYVADHAKRAIVTFPNVSGDYYGVHYGERAKEGVPAHESPSDFVPDGSYSPDRLDWYANIPVPTSYMILDTQFDFFGGYDHAVNAGFVHWADRHIAPGKKQWTWGNHEFGYAWDRNLTDSGGPYIELMAGVYTDNQPDFSFLAPHETKCFSQFWYPIQGIGVPIMATTDIAVSRAKTINRVRVGICVTKDIKDALVTIADADGPLKSEVLSLSVQNPTSIELDSATDDVSIEIRSSDGKVLLFAPSPSELESRTSDSAPQPATEPLLPEQVNSNEELYLTGLHLEQYRHATRMPEDYWYEGIKRDPGDSRCHQGLGRWKLRRGEFLTAIHHLKLAISRHQERNPNPMDGEAFYHLGLAFEYLNQLDEARGAFAKAAWNYEYTGPANLGLARIAGRQEDWNLCQSLLETAATTLGAANSIQVVQAALLRRSGDAEGSKQVINGVLRRDPLDHGTLFEGMLVDKAFSDSFERTMRRDPQNYLDLAFDYLAFGLMEEAIEVLKQGPDHAMIQIVLRNLTHDSTISVENTKYVFPHRLEEMLALEARLATAPEDAIASYLLGNLYYDRRRYAEAIRCWEITVRVQPTNAIAWRNLGIAYFNVSHYFDRSRQAYDQAIAANPGDARVLFERDQLWKRIGVGPEERLKELSRFKTSWEIRDDLSLEICSLQNSLDQPEANLDILSHRQFAPWEGGEGIALGQHSRTYMLLAKKAIAEGNQEQAVQLLQTALSTPPNLGEARHLLANASDLWVALGDALSLCGKQEQAEQEWKRAAEFRGDFQDMAVKTFSEMTYYRATALKRLARDLEASRLLMDLADYAKQLEITPAKIDYFATSLPTMLLFNEDIQARQTITAHFLLAQSAFGLGNQAEAIDWLQDVLKRDPNHVAAQDLLKEISRS